MHIEKEKIKNKLIFLLACCSFLFSEVKIHDKVKIHDEAETFYIKTLDGKDFYLSKKLEEKKPLVFDFFATWCAPCIEEMPLTDSLSHIYPNIDFYFINVSNISEGKEKRKEDPRKVKKLIDKLKIKSPVLLDKYAVVFEKYDCNYLPRLVIINKEGNIEYLHRGKYSTDLKKIHQILENLNNNEK